MQTDRWARGLLIVAVALGPMALDGIQDLRAAWNPTEAILAEGDSLTAPGIETVPLCPLYVNGTAQVAMDVHADDVTFHDCIISNGNVRVQGDAIVFEDKIQTNGTVTTVGEGATFAGGIEPSPIWPYAFAYDPTEYAPGGSRAAIAEAAGAFTYVVGTVHWDETDLSDGLYYVDGNVFVDLATSSNLNASFVVTGKIDIILGNGSVLAPYIDGLVAWSPSTSDTAISATGADSRLDGTLMALSGTVRIEGTDMDMVGIAVADSIRVRGSGHIFDVTA